jgi:biopolymer transport protein ExbD
MKRRGLPSAHAFHPNVTPLIDVVMCLVIFFMLVAKIGVTTGADPTIEVPVSGLGKQMLETFSNTIVLNIREKKPLEQPLITALVDGAESGQPQELRPLDRATGRNQLLDVLKRLRFGRDTKPGGTGGNADNDAFSVIIRGDKEMGYQFLEPVLVACAEAQVRNVIYQTRARTETVAE